MRHLCLVGWLGLALIAGPGLSTPAHAQSLQGAVATASTPAASSAITDAVRKKARGDVGIFYEGRANLPIWIDGKLIGRNAQVLLRYIDEAELDGLSPKRYKAEKLRKAIARADSGDPEELAAAEVELSKAFARFVGDMRVVHDVGIEYADENLRPEKVSTLTALRAATVHSFARHLDSMGWMNPHYVEMRSLLKTALKNGQTPYVINRIRLNIERARVLPSPGVRHIVVDAASARLWYYQGGEEVGSMKVVVGTEATQTPLLVGSLTWAIVNPYWNVPDYLVRENIARKVLSGRTLRSMNMQVLSDWSENAQVVDPKTVDWQAVADGRLDVRVRELPGPVNSMGKVKFLFPNDEGIYLHDTPATDLFKLDDRHKSNGCIRLEKASALGRWMMGDALNLKAKGTEVPVAIPASVPVYLTYLTPVSSKQGVALRTDIYGLDRLN
jgi:murein L,D-transpeptidase YcbB/YkuD